MDRCQPRRRRPLQPHLLALALLLASPLAKAGTGLQQQQQQQQEHRQLLVGVGDLGWVASWISNALATGEGVLIHPVLRPSHCLDGGGGPVKSSWSTFYALTWECNNRAWQFWQHNGFHLWTNLSWKQAWRDFCLRRAAQAGPDEWGGAKGPPIGALVADCNANAGLNQIGFEPDHDASERPNLQLHPRTQSIMFRIVWRNPDPASREAYCLTDHGAEPAAFEKCRGGGKRYALPYPREEEGAPPYSTFTDPAQLWTIPRPFAGVETDGR